MLWYLRRAVPWAALLGCCAGAGLMALLLQRWPTTALLVLPALLACCAAAAAFVFDETSLAVVEVTPRGDAWRKTARLAVTCLPVGVWTALVLVRPGDLPLHRPSWWLVGAAAIALTAGVAGLVSRGAAAAPGGVLAGVAVLTVIGPVILTSFLGWGSVYPIEEFGRGVTALWVVVAAVAGVACLAAVRPRLRG
jgi:hypothetical protein